MKHSERIVRPKKKTIILQNGYIFFLSVLVNRIVSTEYVASMTGGGIRIRRRNRTQRKPPTVTLSSPHIPYNLTFDLTQVAVVGSWQLTA
jgi:hypothetical protein